MEVPNADSIRGGEMDGRRLGLQEYGSDADATVVPLPARHLGNLLGVPVKKTASHIPH